MEQAEKEWSSMNPIERYIAIDVKPAAIRALERHRPTLDHWSARKGREGVRAYQAENNVATIDGLPSGLPVT